MTGRIPQADKDALTFTLRELDPQELPGQGPIEEILFHFREHLFDIVMDAFNSPERVMVVGERIGTDFHALDVRFADDALPGASEPPALGSE